MKRGTVIRAEGEIVKMIDEYATALYEQTGCRVTRTAAAEALLRLGAQQAARVLARGR